MRSLFESTWVTYQPVPQDLSESNFSSQDRVDSEKRLEWAHETPRWYWNLLPWFLTAPLGKTTRKLPKKTSTSYLNGIRGIACLIVFTVHVSMRYYTEFTSNPYGAEPASYNNGFSQLPVIRIMYAGKSMVAIFFVLSGFVLAYSPLRKITSISESHYDDNAIESQELPVARISRSSSTSAAEELITGFSSSILRRGIRLYAPMLVVAAMTCLVTWYNPSFSPGNWRQGDPTFLQHVWRFVGTALSLMNPFSWGVYRPVSFDQCWTLPLEYRGSMVVFLMCMATARLTTRARKLLLLASAFWAMSLQHGEVFTFLCGMFLAELRFCPLSDDLTFLRRIPQSITYAVSICALLCSVFLMGWPENGPRGVEPYQTLSQLTPSAWRGSEQMVTFFWSYASAPVFMAAVENLPQVQWLFSTGPILYLGEISYAFYLLHWLIFLWPGWAMMVQMVNVQHWPMNTSYYIMYFTILGMLIVAADYFWRLVDEKCVRLGKIIVDWLGVHKTRG